MQLPAYYLNHFIFNRIRAGGPTLTLIKLEINGDFGAPLVVFNQGSASCFQEI